MAKGRVLFVCEDERTTDLLRWHFEQDGFGVEAAQVSQNEDATVRLQVALERSYDLLILDGGLENGLADAFRHLRRRVVAPVIFIADHIDTLEALWEAGVDADDYVLHPVRPREVVLRAKAVLRRTGRDGRPAAVLIFPGLRLDRRRQEVWIGERRAQLTRTEFGLLWYLAAQPGTVFGRDQLLREVWGYESLAPADERTVDAYVRRLRRRLEAVPRVGCRIATVWGVGYKFELVPTAPRRRKRKQT